MEQCSNLPEWADLWMPKKEKKCITKLHRYIKDLYLSCISYEKAEHESLDDAIVSSVWQTIDKLVECERDHFRYIADMLSYSLHSPLDNSDRVEL